MVVDHAVDRRGVVLVARNGDLQDTLFDPLPTRVGGPDAGDQELYLLVQLRQIVAQDVGPVGGRGVARVQESRSVGGSARE